MIMNNISSLSENEHSFKDITGKQFITRAIQTDQESGYERSNKLCNKFSRYFNKILLYICCGIYSFIIYINSIFKICLDFKISIW